MTRSRTEEERLARKETDRKRDEEYKSFYIENLSLKKECKKCKKEKSLKDFLPNFTFRNICKECHKNNVIKWRKEKPEETRKISRNGLKRSIEYIHSLKMGKCIKCQNDFPPHVLDFHHISMKEKDQKVSDLYTKNRVLIDKEIEKCVLICANCHRDETQSMLHEVNTSGNRILREEVKDVGIVEGCRIRSCKKCNTKKNEENFTLLKTGYRHSYCKRCLRDYNRNLTERRGKSRNDVFLEEVKESSPCVDCGKKYRYWVMDFDHVRGEKYLSVNKLRNRNMESLKSEIEKCDLVCANCHRVRTANRRALLKT